MNKQFQEMQKKLMKVEEDLKERVVEGESGGGAVKIGVNGTQEVVYVKLTDEIAGGGDRAMLEDLIQVAANQALEKAKKLREREMAKVTGMALPGLM